jgi:hypothetical protein
MYGKTNEFVRIMKWIFCPLTLGRIISVGKSLLEIRNSTSSSILKVIFAIVVFYPLGHKKGKNLTADFTRHGGAISF